MLASNPFLKRLATLLDDGLLAGAADIAALEQEFGLLSSLEEWLDGPGKPLFETALGDKNADVTLR